MTIQEFADQLKKTDDPSPLLRGLQALRRCSLGQLRAEEPPLEGWNPWMDGSGEPPQALALQS